MTTRTTTARHDTERERLRRALDPARDPRVDEADATVADG